MQDGYRWLEALLWPRVVAPALNAFPDSVDDAELVSLLVSGRLRDVDLAARKMGVPDGSRGLMEGALAATHPVGSALLGWVSSFGHDPAASDALVELSTSEGTETERAARAVLAAVALATQERFLEAFDLLRETASSTSGLAGSVVNLQLACRLGEMGEEDGAVELLEALLGQSETEEGELAREVRRVCKENRFNLQPEQRSADLLELQLTPLGDPGGAGSRHTASGLGLLADDVLALFTAPAADPGLRAGNWDEALHQLIGAWLHDECWGAYARVRASRARLGSYAITQGWLPYPSGWSHTSADATDLDLLRRSGNDRLTGAVAARWWRDGPLDDLQRAVRIVAHREWLPPSEKAGLALLGAAGDLLEEEAADRTVDRLADLLDLGGKDRSFLPEFDAAKALARVLAAASVRGHERVASTLCDWADGGQLVLQPLLRLPAALDMRRVSAASARRLQEWAKAAASLNDRNRRGMAVELLLGLQRRLDQRATAVEALIDAFEAAPSLRVAMSLLLSGELPPTATLAVGEFLREHGKSAVPHDDWPDPHVLLAILAEEDRQYAPDVERFLADPHVGIEAKALTLAQVALGSTAADVISDRAAVLLRAQGEVEAADVSGSGERWAWLRALARAGRLDADEALDWIARHAAGLRHERWQAAHALGTLTQPLAGGQTSALYAVLVSDIDIEVAAETARQAPELASVAVDVDVVEPGLRRLLRRPGAHGPLTAARTLARLGLVTAEDRETWHAHPSALVRREAARSE